MIWLLKIIVDLLGTIAAIFLAPLVVHFANRFTGRLPKAFWWMETPDNLLPGDLKEPTVKKVYDRFGWYWTAVYWIGWRNKAYGLGAALRFVPNRSMPMSWRGQRDVSDDNDKRGWAWFRIGPAWEFYAVYGKNFGIRVRLGYKIQPFFQSTDWSNPIWGMPVLHVSLRKLA